ncbi:sulfate transporter family-domain-containing protein [Pelagophyceae sp. CCMP2097]|nr:sulfate transporter family-domain-containing protein [Pelagophyceae sp. CCMP2097]
MGAPCVAYAFFTGSPWASIGVTSITALMARAALAGAHGELDEAAYVDVQAAFAAAVGLASVALALGGAGGAAVRGVPASVKAGFKLGFGVAVVAGQFGAAVSKGSGLARARVADWGAADFGPRFAGAANVANLAYALSHPWHWDAAALALALFVGAGAMRGKRLMPRGTPSGVEVLVFVAAATAVAAAAGYDGAVVGAPPASQQTGLLPPLHQAALLDGKTWARLLRMCFGDSWLRLAFAAVAFAAVDFLQVVSVCASFEADDGVQWSPDRELGAQGVACVASGLAGGGPVGASLSRSCVARLSGASSPRAGFFHGVFAIALLPYARHVATVPKAALAAVVLAAVLPGILQPTAILKLNRADAAVAGATALASVLTDPTTGFVFGLTLATAARFASGPVAAKRAE